MSRIVVCINCGEEKEHEAFGMCRHCYKADYREKNREQMRMYQREYLRRWRRRNPEKTKEYCRSWKERNPERAKERDWRFRENNRETLRLRTKRFRQMNPDYYRQWWTNNREKLAGQKARRRAPKQRAANTLTSEQLGFEKKIGVATYPGEKLHLHHLVPFSKGGGHTWGNIAFIPSSLNLSIQDKLPEEVYKQVELGI